MRCIAKFRKKIFVAGLLLLLAMLVGCQQSEQSSSTPAETSGNNEVNESAGDFPSKEIRMVVNYNVGGVVDLTARALAESIGKNDLLSQPIVVTNVPGSGTVDGLSQVKDANPDGHFLTLHQTAFSTGYHMGILPWNFDQFETIAQVAETPVYAVVREDAPWQTLEDLLNDMRDRPGEVTVGVVALGSITHFAYEMLAEAAGVEGQIIATGAPEQLSAILGGHIDVVFSSVNQFFNEHNNGTVRILGIGSTERLDIVPDVPTFIESGYDIEATMRLGVFGPQGMSDDVIATLSSAIKQAVESEDFLKFAEESGVQVVYREKEEFEAVLHEDDEIIKRIAENIQQNQQK